MESASRPLQEIEAALERLFPLEPQAPHLRLFEAARYSLFPGGKRLRPRLTMAATADLGGAVQTAVLPACALELIHTYSLIHDDLPCMDDDAMRRGKPSLHMAFDEATAVLTGDFLLTKSFELLATAPGLSPSQRLCLIELYATSAGSEGMIGGQLVDIALSSHALTTAEQGWINDKKTGALFSAALVAGGIIAKASEEDLAHLKTLGSHFGRAFQLLDDLIDDEATETTRAALMREITSSRLAIQLLSKPAPEINELILQFMGHAQKSL